MILPIWIKFKVLDFAIKTVLKIIPGDADDKKYEEIKGKVVSVLKNIPDEILEKAKTDILPK